MHYFFSLRNIICLPQNVTYSSDLKNAGAGGKKKPPISTTKISGDPSRIITSPVCIQLGILPTQEHTFSCRKQTFLLALILLPCRLRCEVWELQESDALSHWSGRLLLCTCSRHPPGSPTGCRQAGSCQSLSVSETVLKECLSHKSSDSEASRGTGIYFLTSPHSLFPFSISSGQIFS